MDKKLWEKIKYYRNKYRDTHNGWALSYMIGTEHESDKSKESKPRRRKIGRSKKQIA